MNRIEQIRTEILTQCYGYRPQSRDAERMSAMARREGEMVDANAAEFEREAAYLVGKGLLEVDLVDYAQSHRRYRITSEGIDFLESKGLI